MHASGSMLCRRAAAGGAAPCAARCPPPTGSPLLLLRRPTTAAAAANANAAADADAAAARRRRRPSVSAAAAEPKQQEQPSAPPAGPEAAPPPSAAPTPDPSSRSSRPQDLGGLAGGHAAPGPAPQIASPRAEATAAAADYAAVYDRLIALFEARPREDWKKLVVFSAQWPQHRAGVFARLKSRADAEADVDARVALRRVFRTLQGVDGEVSRYNSCLQRFLDADEHEWEAVVAQHRGDLQRAFFEHLQCLIVAAAREEQVQEGGATGAGAGAGGVEGGDGDDPVKAAAEAVKAAAERAKLQQEAEASAAFGAGRPGKGFGAKSVADAVRGAAKQGKDAAAAAFAASSAAAASSSSTSSPRRPAGTATTDPSTKKERLIAVNARLLALVANHDSVAASDPAALERAAEAYRDVLSGAKSVEDVDAAVEKLAASGRIDPAFLQISARAYGAARDTEMTLDEAKWVSYRMYVKARDHFDRQQPQEKRILEYLVTLRDRNERSRLLDQAVTPGPVRGTDSHDFLYSTPGRLYKVLDGTLRAWAEMQQGAQGKMGVSEKSSTPRRVTAMLELRDEIRRRYL